MRFYGQWNPPVDKFIFQNYFPKKEGGIFLECGAFNGKLESSCLFFERFRGWTGINIEAQPYIFEQLKKNRPDSTNVNVALSNKNGTAKFKHVIHPLHGRDFGNGSLSHLEEHKNILDREGCSYEECTVTTITYKKLMNQLGVKNLDLMVLDVEGHELEVLAGMNGAGVFPDVFCIEYPHVGLDNIKKVVKKWGYKFDKKSHNNAFFIKS